MTTSSHTRPEGTASPEEEAQRFLALVAHELLSPVTVLKGWMAVLARDEIPAQRQAQARMSMLSATDKIERLVRDLLDVSRASVGELSIDQRPVDLRAVVVDVVAAVDDDRVRLLDGPAVPVMADPQRLDQLVTNLVHNGLRHGDGGPVVIAASTSAGVARLTVANGGPPIAADLATRLFEPFARGSESSGSGLGLAVCRAVVEGHGGSIALSRVADQTVVEVALPARSDPTGPAPG